MNDWFLNDDMFYVLCLDFECLDFECLDLNVWI